MARDGGTPGAGSMFDASVLRTGAPRERPQRGGVGLDAHVRAIRQLAALLRSGRTPAEAWTLLEQTWSRAEGRQLRPGLPLRHGPGDDERARREDIVAACVAAVTAHEMGAAPSQGLARHAAMDASGYQAVWTRLLWCISLSETSGAALSTLLDRLAEQLESQQDRHRALEAALAGPRMTQKMLAWLPAVGLLLAQVLGANPLGVLTTSTPGRLCLAAGATLWAANRFWGARLLARATGGTGAAGSRTGRHR